MAGFLDKAKQAAQQALDEAKKGIDTGQAKLDEVQAKREADRLLAALGAAVFAERRHGGSKTAVDSALAALDAHVKVNGLIGFPPESVVPGSSPPASTSAAPPPMAPAPTPSPTPSPSPPGTPPAAGGSSYEMPPS